VTDKPVVNPWLKYNRAAEAGELPQPPQGLNPETKLRYPDWWPAMREFNARPTEGQPYWTPRRIARYYHALKSVPYAANVPEWIDQPKIETAYQTLRSSRFTDWQTWEDNLDNDPGLKEYVRDWAPPPLDAIPQWEQQDLAAVSDAVKSGPVGEWTDYGIDYDTWQTLPEWKKYANRIFRSMGGQMGQQAVNLGIAGASVAGVPGFIGGAALGSGLGYLGMKEGERQQAMGDAYKPSATFYIMGTLNFLFTQLQQGMALRQQIQNSIVDPDTYGGVGEILKDIPAAYEAGEGFYGLLPYEVGSAFSKDGKVRVVNIAGEDTFIDAAPKGEFGSGMALTEIRRMLQDGKLSPSQVREYTVQKYGFIGELSDLLAGYALDPLDIIGPVTGGIIGNAADASGNVALANSFLAPTGSGELLTGYRQYRQNLRQMPVDDVRKMGNVTRWFAGVDETGTDVTLRQQPSGKTAVGKFTDKMFGLTPQSRADGLINDFINGTSTMLEMERGNVEGMYRLVSSLSAITPGDAVNAVENGKIKVTVGGTVTEQNLPRWALSAEAQVVPLMLKDQMPKVRDHYDLYRNTRPQADLINRMAAALDETPYRLIADLQGKNPKTDFDTVMKRIKALADEGSKPAAEFMKNIDSMKDLNNAALKKVADLFSGESGAPFDTGMWGAQLMHILAEGGEKWAVDWFGIKPAAWAARFAGIIKQAQGHLLLGNNPLYLANNAINNIVTMAWDGLLGGMGKKARMDYLRRYGIPTTLRKGIGAAEIGDIDVGVIPGTETGKGSYKLGRVLHDATRAKDTMQATSDLLHKGDKFQLAAVTSQHMERFSSEVATVKGVVEYMNRNWTPGVGYDKISGDLRLVLNAARPGLADQVEKAIARGLNKQEIEAEIFTRLEVPALRDVLSPEEIQMMSSFPGMVDEIDKGIRAATGNEETRNVFREVTRKAEKQMADDFRRKITTMVHATAYKTNTEGLLGAFDAMDRLVPQRHEFWQQHMQHMDDVAAQAEELSGAELNNLWRTELEAADEQWRTFQDMEGAKWLGIFEGLGAEKTGAEHGLVLRNLSDVHDVWSNFYNTRRTLMDEYFDYRSTTDFSTMSKGEATALRSAKWAEINDKLNADYTEAVMVEDAYQVDLDTMFSRRYSDQMGATNGQNAAQWRDKQLKIRRTMVQAMTLFRTGNLSEQMVKGWGKLLPQEVVEKIVLLNNSQPLYAMPRSERINANKKFYRDIYRPLIGAMMQEPKVKTSKPKKGKPNETVTPAEKQAASGQSVPPQEIKPAEKAEVRSSVWKLISEKKPEFAQLDPETGRPDPNVKLNVIKWLRKWSMEARTRNVKKWADVTPALVLEAWHAEQAAPKVETPPVIESEITPVDTVQGEVPETTKEPWQLTRDEFATAEIENGLPVGGFYSVQVGGKRNFFEYGVGTKRFKTLEKAIEAGQKEHKKLVRQAVLEGKDVPPEVLADYPTLAKQAAENADLSASVAEEAAITEGLTPEAAARVEEAQAAEAAREYVIAKGQDMRQNADEILQLAPPKEVNGEIFREYLHQIFADRYPDKQVHGANRAEAVWTVIDRIATTLANEQGITKDQWYQNFVLTRGGTEIGGSNLYRANPQRYLDSIKRIDYQRGNDWYEYNIVLKDGTTDSATVSDVELRTVLGDSVAQKIIDGDSFGSLQGNDLQGLSTSGYLVRGATGATYWLENGRAVIHAFSRADVADMLHEYIHAITPLLAEGDKGIVKAWYEAEYKRTLPDDWADRSMSDVDAMEKLARAFERYMVEGPKGFIGEIVQVFENIKSWMLDIYKSLKHDDINIRMNDDMRGMFDRWLGAEPKPATVAIEPPAPKPDMWQKRKPQQRGFFQQGEDTPLFSGVPERAKAETFAPQETGQQDAMFDMREQLRGIEPVQAEGGAEGAPLFEGAQAEPNGLPVGYEVRPGTIGKTKEQFAVFSDRFMESSYFSTSEEAIQDFYKKNDRTLKYQLREQERLNLLSSAIKDIGSVTEEDAARIFRTDSKYGLTLKAASEWLRLESGAINKHGSLKAANDYLRPRLKGKGKMNSNGDTTFSLIDVLSAAVEYPDLATSIVFDANEIKGAIERSKAKGNILFRTETRAVTRGEWSAFEDRPGHLVVEHAGTQKATADIEATGVPSQPTYAELTLPERNEVTALLREFKQTYQQRTSYPPGILYRTPTDSEGGSLNEPPVSGAPLGTTDELNGMPIEEITLEGWNTQLRPLLQQAQTRVLEQPRNKIDLQAELPKEGMVSLKSYLGKVYTQLADTKMGATRWGESRRDAALLDYSKKTGIEQLAFSVIPYGFWYTHTAINWVLRALSKPSIIANYYRLLRMSQRKESDDGYPQRLKGKMAIPAPWLPDFMGDSIYIDPWRQAFPILQMTRPFERAAQEKNQIERRTDQLIYDMVDNGEISDDQAQEAIDNRAGSLYIKAKAQAEGEQEGDFQNPFDFAFALSSPLLPLTWAYQAATGRADKIGQLPFTRLVQNMTAMAGLGGPRGVNLEAPLRRGLGLPEVDRFEDYRVSRELANMVADGLIDTDTASRAMIDRTGEAFQQAQRRVSQQGAIKFAGGALALDIFPEGEMKQRGLADEFAAAYDAKAKGDKEAVNKFFEKYPEYSARLLTFKEPEEQLRAFLRSIIWEKYLALPKAQAKEFRAAAGDVFEEAFYNSETRSYDSISTDTLAMWANTLGETPEKAGTAELPVDWLDDATAKAIDTYYNEKTRVFGEYDPNAELDPNYTTWQNQYLAAHPDIIKYVIGETNKLYGLPEDIQLYVYQYRADRDTRYPGIFDLQEQYFALNTSQRKAFIKDHPELPAYWDFRRQRAADFPKAAAYIMSEESLSAEILDEDRVSYSGGGSTGGYTSGYSSATYSDGRPAENYHPPYLTSSEIRRFSQPLIMQLLARFYRNEKLMPGAYAELTSIWEQLGKPFGNMEDFIENAVKPTIMQ